jgi:D-alanine-D-alanine ligase-like ATP-grasp enzyme
LTMLDKSRTYALAREHGIPVPQTIPLRDRDQLEAAMEEIEFPCVLKPAHSHLFARRARTGAKVSVVNSPAELRATFERLSALELDVFVTEVVYGLSDEFVSYYGYLDAEGQSLLSFTKRKIRQNPPGFGIGTYHESTDDPEVAELGLRFLRAVGLKGLGNLEFKRDARSGELKLIECNPRFTLSNELIRASGVDLALFSYNRAAGYPTTPVTSYRVGMRLWDPFNDLRAFIAYRRLGELSAWEWLGSLMYPQHFPAFRTSDPLPALARAASRLRNGRSRGQSPRQAPSTRSTEPPAPVKPVRREAEVWGANPGSLVPRPRGVNRLIEELAGSSSRGRAVAARLDLLHSTGVGPMWRRVRAERQFSAFGSDVRDAVYERIWADAADSCAAEFTRLGTGLFQLDRAGASTRVYHQMVELDNPATLQVALDKVLVQRLMAAADVSHAEYLEWSADDPAPALAFLARADGLCVVKPAAGTAGGHGVTPGIESPEDLLRARLYSATGGGRLLIERQVEGAVYRLLFLDGELLDTVRTLPTSLTGDGRSTIEALIVRENERRVAGRGDAGLSLIGASLDMLLTLRRAQLKLSSVLPAGQRVAIRVATNDHAAQDSTTWRGHISSELIDQARAATQAVGLHLGTVEVITTDIARPLAETGGIVAEVNGTPGLHHHYLVADPDRATRVAIPILEHLLSRKTTGERGGAPARRSEPAPWSSGPERLAGPDSEPIERRA